MKLTPQYVATFEFAHRLRLEMRMSDHYEHRWHWTHRYAPQPEGRGTQPEIVNDLRISARYIEGELQLPLKVIMNIVIPSRLGKHFFAGMDLSPGAKTYVEFHYGDPDAERTLRLMRIEVGATRMVDLPAPGVDGGNALVLPMADFPFPVLEQLPLTWGCYYRVPFLAEGEMPLRGDGTPDWPFIDVRRRIRVGPEVASDAVQEGEEPAQS